MILKKYGLLGGIRLLRDIITTKIFFPETRIVRQPAYIRGRKYIKLSAGFTTGVGLRLDAFPELISLPPPTKVLIIGRNVEVNDYVHIAAVHLVEIKDNVLIASKVFISDHNHGYYGNTGQVSSPDQAPGNRALSYKPVIIEENVWLGEQVVILPGVTIGKGSIIGASSVVTQSIPPFSIAVGSPAKVIKRYNHTINAWETA
jgi:acetyltransferase-like isoleucine patch superfamily enzyme